MSVATVTAVLVVMPFTSAGSNLFTRADKAHSNRNITASRSRMQPRNHAREGFDASAIKGSALRRSNAVYKINKKSVNS